MKYLWVALAGAAGAVTRYAIAVAFGTQIFPWATLGVNITGSFLVGFVVTLATERSLSPELATAVIVGFIGAFTTFSTFAWEGFVLGRTDRAGIAAVYVAVSIVGGLAAAWAGYQLARTVT